MESTLSKTKTYIAACLLFLCLAVFPFGQLPALFLNPLDLGFRLHLLDVLVLGLGLYSFLVLKIGWPQKARAFLIVAIFSYLLSRAQDKALLPGLFYLIRLVAYLHLPKLIYWLVRKQNLTKTAIIQTLIALSIIVAVFGMIQYVLFPDLTAMKYFGWDDHYYRLVSVFLDPAFTGIILVLGALLTMSQKNKYSYLWLFILSASLALTFSRASFLALVIALPFLPKPKDKFMSIAFSLVILCLVLLISLKPGGEGVKLTRTSSIAQKLGNYKEGVELILKAPLFGVGYNNLCAYKEPENQSNSCFGLDNSLLFILATTGFLGLMSYLYLISSLYKIKYLRPSLVAVLVHAQFTNTLFYAWVMFWLMLVWGTFMDDR